MARSFSRKWEAPVPDRETTGSPRGCMDVRCGYADRSPPFHESETRLPPGDSLRFPPAEVEDFRKLGIDFDGVRTQADVEAALATWTNVLGEERPDLLEKIALEMAKAKGVLPPPRLSVVGPAHDSPEQS